MKEMADAIRIVVGMVVVGCIAGALIVGTCVYLALKAIFG